jgi:hypothetical protein
MKTCEEWKPWSLLFGLNGSSTYELIGRQINNIFIKNLVLSNKSTSTQISHYSPPRFFWLTHNHLGFDHKHQKLWSKIKSGIVCLTYTSVTFVFFLFQFLDVVKVTIIYPKENVKFGCISHVYEKRKRKKKRGSFCIILSYLREPIMKNMGIWK